MSQYKNLTDFLCKHLVKSGDKSSTITHTRIPSKPLNIYGGSYSINPDELKSFLSLYYENVFIQNRMEYLTEKQLDNNGPILIDFDFRYDYEVTERMHTFEHIQDIIILYLEELKQFYLYRQDTPFSIYIMEKEHVNRSEDKMITKDGIHMIIGIQMDRVMQLMLRDKILKKIHEVWDIPELKNSWETVIDDSICKGKTNWQMFGSRKPGNEAYKLTHHFVITFDEVDGEFGMKEQRILDFDLSKNLFKLSAQYPDNPKFEINPKIKDEYEKRCKSNPEKVKKPGSSIKVHLLEEDSEVSTINIGLGDITNKDILKKAMDNILNTLAPREFYIKETHEYTQILPEKYYEPGSHLLNRQIAFALKHTDDRLFLSWVMLRSKASDFEYSAIPELFQIWKNHINNNKLNGVTRRSIMYWAKQDAHEDFEKVKNSTVDRYIEDTITTPTEYDFAMVLYHMYRDKYVWTNKSWYVFVNHRWEPDMGGQSLRLCISRDMYEAYHRKIDDYNNEMQKANENDDQDKADTIKKKIKYVSEMSVRLKKTTDKNNIMREATDLFCDRSFIKNVDANPYLMCFSNGVIDFKNKEFRHGYPQDYITKSTNIPYYPYDPLRDGTLGNEIVTFFKQLFPVESLCKYMWDHLASCLIGTNLNQTFNIYRGSGSNGKSILIDLMQNSLGEYKGTVPITLVTEKRNGIGGTSSEVIQLKGTRFAVMQEPTKGAQINEGVMKELTGGDPIQARALYAESEIFTPQFKLCVCTNTLFEVNSNDDGTWRRIRLCDFMSKFVDVIETGPDAPQYQFLKDKKLKEKLVIWAPIFVSMLVERAFDTDGHVEDCDIVMASSNKYRQGQDHIAAFIDEMISKTGVNGDRIKKTELSEEFKRWFQASQGMRKMPKGTELYEFMDKKFGKCKSTGWHGVKIIYPETMDEIEEIEM